MVAITPEHYNRIARLLQHGITPKLTFDIQTETYKNDQMGFNEPVSSCIGHGARGIKLARAGSA
jgi:hypothetical protein